MLVLVNTLGATPVMEAFIVLRRVAERLAGMGVELHRALVGEYVTSLEMAGLSLTVTALDAELRPAARRARRGRCARPPRERRW